MPSPTLSAVIASGAPRIEPKWTMVNEEWVAEDRILIRTDKGWSEDAMKHIEAGSRFGSLVVGKLVTGPSPGAYYECLCDCGKVTVAQGSAMRTGNKTSCGCRLAQRQSARKYQIGSSSDPEYFAWRAAISRCGNPKNAKWSLYGGRGIRVCSRWLESYDAFIADMGRRPSAAHSLDRIDGNGDYEPSNCRWATSDEQNNNRSNNRHVSVDGEELTIAQASRALGVPDATLRRQVMREIHRGPRGRYDLPTLTNTNGAK